MVGRILEIEKTKKKHLIKEITFVSENGHRFKAIGPILEGSAGEYYELTGSWVDDVFKFTYAKRSYSCEEEAINEILGFGLMLSKEQAKECIPLLYSTKTKEGWKLMDNVETIASGSSKTKHSLLKEVGK